MFLGVVVLGGNWQRGSCPTGVSVLQGSCSRGNCPQGSCPRGSCHRGCCPITETETCPTPAPTRGGPLLPYSTTFIGPCVGPVMFLVWVCKGFGISTCWYSKCESLALGFMPNARP